MKTICVWRTGMAGLCAWGLLGGVGMSEDSNMAIKLPPPQRQGGTALAETLAARSSSREFAKVPLTPAEVGQLCWAAQGLTGTGNHRTAPSAGALYPLELYVVVGRVKGIDPGIYHYAPGPHALQLREGGDRLGTLAPSVLQQDWVRDAAVAFVITAVYERTTGKYHDRGVRYTHIEAGHAAQNLLLQTVALGLSGCPVGAFNDDNMREFLTAPAEESPLYLLPVGRP